MVSGQWRWGAHQRRAGDADSIALRSDNTVMPPDGQSGDGMAMLSALAGRAGGFGARERPARVRNPELCSWGFSEAHGGKTA